VIQIIKSMGTIKIGIIDNQTLFAKTLAIYLNKQVNFKVESVTKTYHDFISENTIKNATDILLIGMNVPNQYEDNSIKTIKNKFKKSKIIGLGALEGEKYISKIILSGIHGFIFKSIEPEKLVEAIQTTVKEGYSFNYETLDLMRKVHINKKDNTNNNQFSLFSKKELEIIKLICKEMTGSEISKALKIAEKTLESHKRSIMSKMGVKKSIGIAIYAISNGLVNA